jgi:arylsulfatase A-like enzyme
MLTGLYPGRHGAVDFARSLSGDAATLAEILRDEGFGTAAVMANLLLTSRYGLDQGFELWDQDAARGHEYVSTQAVTDAAIRFLDQLAGGSRRFFLFVHYFDPHFQYRRHPEYGFSAAQAGRVDGTEPLLRLRELFGTLTDEEVDLLVDRYDEEIRFTDAGIARLLARLEALGLDDDTLVVVAADHGEEFHSRGWVGHTRTLYEELVRVPLLVRDPRHPGPRLVDRAVSLAGLTPTVLDLLEVAPSAADFQVESFAAGVRGEPAGWSDEIFLQVEFHPRGEAGFDKAAFKKALIRDRWKIIADDSTGAHELYDLEADPRELVDRAATRPDLADPLAAALRRRVSAAFAGALSAPEVALRPERLEQLRALGYAGN